MAKRSESAGRPAFRKPDERAVLDIVEEIGLPGLTRAVQNLADRSMIERARIRIDADIANNRCIGICGLLPRTLGPSFAASRSAIEPIVLWP